MARAEQASSKERVGRGIRRVDLAYAQLASSEIARDMNRDVVLELIRARQPVSRADLARLSGLQRSTVSDIVSSLIEEGWVREGSLVSRPRGRRPTLVMLNDAVAMLVADIRPQQAIVAVVDLNGYFLSRESVTLSSNPERAIENVVDVMQKLRAQHPNKSFEGVGIALPGRVDPVTQRMIFAPNLQWKQFDIRKAVEKGTGLKVELENAGNACILSEMWFGRMDGVRNAVLVTISEGIGTGIIANGQPVSGNHGMAGEFGHIPLDPNGLKCACGEHGCWETFASSRAALRYYQEISGSKQGIGIHEFLRLVEEGDAQAIQAIQKQSMQIGRGLRLLTAGLSPEIIFIAGDITLCWNIVAPVIEAEMKRGMLAGTPPRLMPTQEGELARLRGAAALVLQRHSGRHRSRDIAISSAGRE